MQVKSLNPEMGVERLGGQLITGKIRQMHVYGIFLSQ